MHVECSVLPEERTIAAVTAVALEADEDRLIARAKEGDRSAFEQLYRRHAGRVYAVCLRLTGRHAEAEDMAQEAFIRAWQKLGSFEGRSRFSSWMHRLAVNVVVSEKRARRREDGWQQLDEAAAGAGPPSPRGGEGDAADLERAVASLPDGARFAFVLHDVYGYQHEEISEMMSVAVGTSKAQLHRARRLLRERLGS